MWRSLSTVLGGHHRLSLEQPLDSPVVSSGPTTAQAHAVWPAPDLVGLPIAEARRRVRLAGAAIEVTERAASGGLWGRVLAQTPVAGEAVSSDGAIALVIGARPHVTVPDVRGRDEDDALSLLREVGLGTAGRATRRSDRVPEGRVVRTRPRAGADVPVGSLVSYVVAAAPWTRGHARRDTDRRRVRVGRLPDGSFQAFPDE
jgi:beta-lactam-binding protein with PASTA domain